VIIKPDLLTNGIYFWKQVLSEMNLFVEAIAGTLFAINWGEEINRNQTREF